MNQIKYLWWDRSYLISKRRERVVSWIAWHLPRKLALQCYIRVGVHATTGPYSNTLVPELTMIDGIKRWDAEAL